MKPIGSVTKTESEKVVGEDEFKLPIVDCPEVIIKTGARTWYKCSCGREALIEVNGKEYYHATSCPKSNGVPYGPERVNTTLPHHPQCDCMTCQPPKGAK